jgi:hypothetical protein
MGFYQSLGILLLLIVKSNSGRYGILAFPPNFRGWPETVSGPNHLFLSIDANLLLMMLVLMAKDTNELAHRSVRFRFHSYRNNRLLLNVFTAVIVL